MWHYGLDSLFADGFEFVYQLSYQALSGLFARFDDNIRDLRVEWITLLEQLLQFILRILGLQQGTVFIATGPAQ
jgi:hypothetical protein